MSSLVPPEDAHEQFPWLEKWFDPPDPASIQAIDDMIAASVLPRELDTWMADRKNDAYVIGAIPIPPSFAASPINAFEEVDLDDEDLSADDIWPPYLILEMLRQIRSLEAHTLWTLERLRSRVLLEREYARGVSPEGIERDLLGHLLPPLRWFHPQSNLNMNEYKRRPDYLYLHEDMEAPSPDSVELIDDLLDAGTPPMEMTLPQDDIDRIAIGEYLYWSIDFLDEDKMMARELSARHSALTPPESTTSTVDVRHIAARSSNDTRADPPSKAVEISYCLDDGKTEVHAGAQKEPRHHRYRRGAGHFGEMRSATVTRRASSHITTTHVARAVLLGQLSLDLHRSTASPPPPLPQLSHSLSRRRHSKMSQSTEVSLERHDPQIAIDRLYDLLRVHNRRSEYPWYQVEKQDVELLRDIILRVFDFESSKYDTFILQANARGIRVETPVQNPIINQAKHLLTIHNMTDAALEVPSENKPSPAIAALDELLAGNAGYSWYKVQKEDVQPLKDHFLPIMNEMVRKYDTAVAKAKELGFVADRKYQSIGIRIKQVETGDETNLAGFIYALVISSREIVRLTARLDGRRKNYLKSRRGSEKTGWESVGSVRRRKNKKM
ncbi:uncharacterized protein MYCGRDRAFT_94719 [Zymoseptoria tritici IPO323]|uniref:Uncharacterized protein n=1 Tax=Zymoseptoria tritici (strain CBS 115943 / IPO323) TaxID=336722 RepID=F9XET5_ZYMTI|nr:uncharacterized protein MYCGRDRAFT_94719 [Zymoseptoria tritici IPO323]EGP85823.1 hypothetical protein MYCGRDRAFT_94719 [Zymoseptoria tritici IPO323]